MQRKPDKYGMGPIFGNQANFNRYLVSDLVKRRVNLLRSQKRLVLTGYFQSFRAHHVSMHRLLTELNVPHTYRDGPKRDHHWESGWLDEAVRLLLSP
jgi:acetyl esterase/lipase